MKNQKTEEINKITLNRFKELKIYLQPYLVPDWKHENTYKLNYFFKYWDDKRINIYFDKFRNEVAICYKKKENNKNCFEEYKRIETTKIKELEEYCLNLTDNL